MKNIELNKQSMIEKANELRNTSNDLTKYARLYVVTKKQDYKDIYFHILDIKNGISPRPFKYQYMYWDLIEPKRSQLHPLEKAVVLKEEMAQLPYSKYELKKLEKAEKKSNTLVNLELMAFKMMEKNQTLAINLLYSQEYFQAKYKVMLPLDYFLMFLTERNQQQSNELQDVIRHIFYKMFFVFLLGVITLIIIYIAIYKKVLQPIKSLTKTILDYQEGKHVSDSIKHYNDEIGTMIEHFYAMKKKQDLAYKDMESLASIDGLTGVMNKRVFTEVSEEILKLSNRNNKELSILMLDIDFFKKVNDTYGHMIGDEILKHLVHTVKNALRESDIFARFGGEEFIILLLETDENSTLLKAEKIRRVVKETAYVENAYNIVINISIGVAYKKDEAKIIDLINRADEALYMSKNNGRNQVQSK